jgi:hypothetical protein
VVNDSESEKNIIGKKLELGEPNLLEMMEICSELYLSSALAVRIIAGFCEEISEQDEPSRTAEILLFAFPPVAKRLMQIH